MYIYSFSYVSSNLIDMDSIYMESSSQTPIVLMYAEESETVRRHYIQYARSKVGSSYSIVDINQLGLLTEDKQIKRILSKPMEDVNIIALIVS